METDPTSSLSRSAVDGAEVIHRTDGSSEVGLRTGERVVEARWWPAPGGLGALVFMGTPGFEAGVARLAMHLALGGVHTLFVRHRPGHAALQASQDIECGARFLATRGATRFAFGGAGNLAGAAAEASRRRSSTSLCAFVSPSERLSVLPVSGCPCLIACGDDSRAALALARELGDRARFLAFPLAPETLAEVAGDLAAVWVPAIVSALR